MNKEKKKPIAERMKNKLRMHENELMKEWTN